MPSSRDLPIPEMNPGLPHQPYSLLSEPLGSLRILNWVAISSPGDLPALGIELGSPASQTHYLTAELTGKPKIHVNNMYS